MAGCGGTLLAISSIAMIFSGILIPVVVGESEDPPDEEILSRYAVNIKFENSQTENENACTRLPPTLTRTPAFGEDDINFSEILKSEHGSIYLKDMKLVPDAILLLGNTGSGKSTTAQILGGNLSRLHAMLTAHGNRMVIVDDDERIGAPTTVSRTLIPDLVVNAEGGSSPTAFYDCPGFDDTRGPEHDIVANLLMKEILGKVNNIKFLFLVTQSSVQLGNDRLDFDLMIKHAVKLIKNPLQFKDSIGLVVTKVNNFDFSGRMIQDSEIVKEIGEFISVYNEALYSSLKKKDENDRKIRKMIELVSIFLEKDESSQQFQRIAFLRQPNQCGSIDKVETVTSSINSIVRLYKQLKFSSVQDPTHEFGYTLKYDTVDNITTFVEQSSKDIAQQMKKLFTDFQIWYRNENYNAENDEYGKFNPIDSVTEKLKNLQEHHKLLETLLEDLKAKISQDTLTPSTLQRETKIVLENMGYPAWPKKFDQLMGIQEKLLNFYDEIVERKMTRSENEWIRPIEEFQKTLLNYLEWYKICAELWENIKTYEFQESKPEVEIQSVEWKEFISTTEIITVNKRDDILALWNNVEKRDIAILNAILEFGLTPTEISCQQKEKITVKGNFVRFQEVLTSQKCSVANADVKTVEIISSWITYIDKDFNGVGRELNVILISPIWHVIGEERYINLNGSKGRDADQNGAAAASLEKVKRYTNGHNGKHGAPGFPGGPGGTFVGVAQKIIGGEKLQVSSCGGDGGGGQNGGKGADGSPGRPPSNYNVREFSGFNIILFSSQKGLFDGHHGYPGGNGGDGGVGGFGGLPGNVTIIVLENPNKDKNSTKIAQVEVRVSQGKNGQPGLGGEGGTGGEPGEGLLCTQTHIAYIRVDKDCEQIPSRLERAKNGQSGRANVTIEGIQTPKQSSHRASPLSSLLHFKILYYNQTYLKAFLAAIDNNVEVQNKYYLELESFQNELIALVDASKEIHSHDAKALREIYRSFIDRLEHRSFNQSQENKNAASFILGTAYIKTIALKYIPVGRVGNNGSVGAAGLIFKIEQCFDTLLKQKIMKWENAGNETGHELIVEILERVQQVKSFFVEVISDLQSSLRQHFQGQCEKFDNGEIFHTENIPENVQTNNEILEFISDFQKVGRFLLEVVQFILKSERNAEDENELVRLGSTLLVQEDDNNNLGLGSSKGSVKTLKQLFLPIVLHVLDDISNERVIVEKWDMPMQLNKISKHIQQLTRAVEASPSGKELTSLVSTQDAIDLLIHLYENVEQYSDIKRIELIMTTIQLPKNDTEQKTGHKET